MKTLEVTPRYKDLEAEEAKAIANTIKAQIGWNALAGTAATKMTFDRTGSLIFKIQNNKGTVKGWTYTVKVTLTPEDLYTLTVTRHRLGKACQMEMVHRVDGLFCDMLHEAVYEAADYPNLADNPVKVW